MPVNSACSRTRSTWFQPICGRVGASPSRFVRPARTPNVSAPSSSLASNRSWRPRHTPRYGRPAAIHWRIGPGGLFDPGRVQAARARLEAACLEAEKTSRRVRREVVEAWTKARSLADQIATAKEGLEAAQETLRLSAERKEFGIAAVLEHVLAEQDLTRARHDYVSAVAEHDKAQYALLRAMGAVAGSASAP